MPEEPEEGQEGQEEQEEKRKKQRAVITPFTIVLVFLALNFVATVGTGGYLLATGKLDKERAKKILEILAGEEEEAEEVVIGEDELRKKVTEFKDEQEEYKDLCARRLIESKDSESKLKSILNDIELVKKEIEALRDEIKERQESYDKQVEERAKKVGEKGFKKTVRVIQEMEAIRAAEQFFAKKTDGGQKFTDDEIADILLAISDDGFIAEILNGFYLGEEGAAGADAFVGNKERASAILKLLLQGGRKIEGTVGGLATGE